MKTIELYPKYSGVHYYLADSLDSFGESIMLNGGTVLTKQQLYLKAIELGCNDCDSYIELANSLEYDGTIKRNDDTEQQDNNFML